ncbi:VOC family protein [Henriciella sp.]|uniref:VOC family protein n=1 Tax=Henriciella sp. TaxID=1968823 RepID=UPI00260F4FF8|nr:VOC family protein [Henriciella sp.]
MAAPIVFFDIAAPDSDALRGFYKSVFDWPTEGENFTVPVTAPIEGTIRPDPAEKMLYVGVPDLTKALEDIVAAGGTIDVPRFEVPGMVILGLFKDPAGNRMGLVEMDGDAPKVP